MKNSKTIISTSPSLVTLQEQGTVTEAIDGIASDYEEEAGGFELQSLEVGLDQQGQRLDVVLTALLASFSRSYVQQRIDAGDVKVNGKVVTKTSAKASAGDDIEVALRETVQSQAFKPQEIALEVVYEDAHLLVINKPAGLVVHPAPGNWQGTLLNGLLFRDPSVVNLPRAGIVHRLDKDTSGLMVVAKNRLCMDALVTAIADREVHRSYLALSAKPWHGAAERQMNSPIGRDPHNRVRMAVVDLGRNAGKQAKTDFLMLDSNEKGCWVQCTLHTGRTHQIRVHMASMGYPLLGDTIYGGVALYDIHRQALHAFKLSLIHPISGTQLALTSELPADMVQAMRLMGLRYNTATPRDGAMAVK